MVDQPCPKDATLKEQLVAYLDGELDLPARRRIEALLASDPQVRQMVQGLDRTWELLGEVFPDPPASKFTQTTLEMVAQVAQDDAEQNRRDAPWRRRRRWVLLGCALLAAGGAGFLTLALLWPNPNRQLLEDTPLLERLDEYRQIDDIHFLHLLRDSGMFPVEENDDA